ncbi:MAG: hypothetical protein KC502_19555, partial [Myxococcales bacterium]|nr:hypothetical protein [Myxococcales bacterium]
MKHNQPRSRSAVLAFAALAIWAAAVAGCSADKTEDGPDAGAVVSDVPTEADATVDSTTGGADASDTTTSVDAADVTVEPDVPAKPDSQADAGVAKDECNGIDDDKDGQTDEDACDDGDLCTADLCDGPNKQCTWKKIGEGEPCDDGDACTQKEKCTDNKCVSTEATACDDGVACTDDICNKA